MVELQAGIRTCNGPGPGQCCELAAATHKIVVDVRLEDVRDAHGFAARHVQVLIDVAQRVNERRDPASFGDHQVGAVAQAFVDELPHPHASRRLPYERAAYR